MEVKLSRDRPSCFRGRFEYGQKLKRKKRVTLCCLCENRYKLRTKQNDNLVRLFLGCKTDLHVWHETWCGICYNAMKGIEIVCTYTPVLLFWVITQRVVVIPYGRFGTSYRYRLQGSRVEDGTDRLLQNFGKELPLLAV